MAVQLTGMLAQGAGPLPPGARVSDAELSDKYKPLLENKEITKTIDQVLEEQTAEKKKEDKPAEEANKSTEEIPDKKLFCPKCAWDYSLPAGPDPTDEDKRTFRRAVIKDERWAKSYTLFGGSINVTFRTLTTQEEEACVTRALTEVYERKHLNDGMFFRAVSNYKLALGVARLEREGLVYNVDEAENKTVTQKLDAAIAELLDKHLKNSPVKASVAGLYYDFDALAKKLQVRGYDASFW